MADGGRDPAAATGPSRASVVGLCLAVGSWAALPICVAELLAARRTGAKATRAVAGTGTAVAAIGAFGALIGELAIFVAGSSLIPC